MSAVATGIFILTGDNALPLTTFALAFSPVNPLSVAANAATKERFTGRKQNKRKRILLSSRRSPKEGVNGGENGLSEATTRCLFVKIKKRLFPDMRREKTP